MSTLARQRCFLHAQREAAARCPECRHMFCRECVTEHGDRMLCANCLRKLTSSKTTTRGGVLKKTAVLLQCAIGLSLCLVFFYGFGRFLLSMPGAYHEGTLWKQAWTKLTAEP